jgi:hypothetical protein
VWVDIEEDVFESENAKSALLVIEWHFRKLKLNLRKRLEIFSDITEFLLDKDLSLALHLLSLISLGSRYIQSLRDSKERLTGHFEYDPGQEPPLALVLDEASFALSLIKRTDLRNLALSHKIIKPTVPLDVDSCSNAKLACDYLCNRYPPVLAVLTPQNIFRSGRLLFRGI